MRRAKLYKQRWIYIIKGRDPTTKKWVTKIGVLHAKTKDDAITNGIFNLDLTEIKISSLRKIYNPIIEDKLNEEFGIYQDFV